MKNGGRLGAWRRLHRENAIHDCMPEVQRIARRVRLMFTHHIQIDDLEQAGYVGLCSAANTYDPRNGAFAAYAYWRIRGEMIDSQKRRTFREAANVSLQGIAAAHDGCSRSRKAGAALASGRRFAQSDGAEDGPRSDVDAGQAGRRAASRGGSRKRRKGMGTEKLTSPSTL